jgi:hypothetical protein
MINVSVWGQRYRSVAEMRQRLAVLAHLTAQFGESDDRVSESNALTETLAKYTPRPKDPRPFVVLYRKAVGEEIFKGRRTFKTAAEQSRWIWNAGDDVAITFYTN